MSEVNMREGIVFGVGGGRELRCDIYSAANLREPAPALLLLHPGGWSGGDRGRMRDIALRIAAEGFVCIAPEYRLTGETPWPAQIEDVKAAIRWIHAESAALGIDETRIAALGVSAGGHLALLAAGTQGLPEFAGRGGNAGASEALAAVVGLYPATLFYSERETVEAETAGEAAPRGGHPASHVLGDAATSDVAHRMSPLTDARPGFPPTLLIHGTADETIRHEASEILYEALRRAEVPVELHLYAQQPHAFGRRPEFIDQVCAESVHFLRRYLSARTLAGAKPAAASV